MRHPGAQAFTEMRKDGRLAQLSFSDRGIQMKHLPLIYGVLLAMLLVGAIGYLIVLNRPSASLRSMLFPAIFIGLTAVLFTTWFSLKSEEVDARFVSAVFYHKSDKKPLDEHCSDHRAFGGPQFDITLRSFIDEYLPRDENKPSGPSSKNDKEVAEFYQDVVFLNMISLLFRTYAVSWDVRISHKQMGNALATSRVGIEPKPAECHLQWGDFLKSLDSESEFRGLLASFSDKHFVKKVTMPRKTQVQLKISRHERSLVLRNPFVRVSIKMFWAWGPGGGLGDYRWLLGYDDKRSDEFSWLRFEVTCNATFERTRSLHPDMKRYKRWVETMFAEVQYQFDDDMRLNRARDYRDLVSGQNR